MDRIEAMLRDARDTRNHIVQANMRLVVSIARKFVTDFQSFDELVSDGNLTLMRAVECFDYGRGYRFSTYATHAIRRDFYRHAQQARRRRSTEFTTAAPEILDDVESSESSERHMRDAKELDYVVGLMRKHLKDRDQRLLELRYGLSSREGLRTLRTLREVGVKLGISKERVRQLQLRALGRIQQLAVADQSG